MRARKIVAVDVGGTSARFAYFTIGADGKLEKGESTWLGTKDFASFVELLRELETRGFSLAVDGMAIAAAGAVEQGTRATLSNVGYAIDLREVQAHTRIADLALCNDFVAQAYACTTPVATRAEIILDGTPIDRSRIAVVGAGTGLGKALLLTVGPGRHLALPSEGGHANFAPESKDELEFSEFVSAKLSRRYTSWEDVVSGKGLSYLYEFHHGQEKSPAEVAALLSASPKVLEWFSRFYGRVCRNYALEVLATGGVFIAGGVAAKNPLLVKHDAFGDEFRHPRTYEKLFSTLPVRLITDEESGLWGAAALAVGSWQDRAK